jgi:hypothetical protein
MDFRETGIHRAHGKMNTSQVSVLGVNYLVERGKVREEDYFCST